MWEKVWQMSEVGENPAVNLFAPDTIQRGSVIDRCQHPSLPSLPTVVNAAKVFFPIRGRFPPFSCSYY